jgi:Arc/MetJ-type ribon-helix-helix transcriptional regulator
MEKAKRRGSRKPVSLPPDLAKAVEDYRFENRFNTESEAIRRLIELGLKAVAKAGKAKP